MSVPRWSASRLESLLPLTPTQWGALRLLQEALEAALTQSHDLWQFAVEIDQLRSSHVTNTDLRRLLCWGYIEHARERTRRDGRQRSFQHLSTLSLPKRVCFVLTVKGLEVLAGHRAISAAHPPPGSFRLEVPRWDRRSRQLWWQDYLVKQLHRPAANQELVLNALEEEGWPACIDDPLPQKAGIEPKARLHDTIKNLNRHHLHGVIAFRGDGSGTAVRWRRTETEQGHRGLEKVPLTSAP